MIDNCLGIATDVGGGGLGVMILFFFFFKDRSSLQYFITQGWVRVLCSLPFALYVILGGGLRLWLGWEEGKEESQGGSIPVVYYETCLKTQPAHKPLISRRGPFPLRGLLFFSN